MLTFSASSGLTRAIRRAVHFVAQISYDCRYHSEDDEAVGCWDRTNDVTVQVI